MREINFLAVFCEKKEIEVLWSEELYSFDSYE